jgi:hypothetical protein
MDVPDFRAVQRRSSRVVAVLRRARTRRIIPGERRAWLRMESRVRVGRAPRPTRATSPSSRLGAKRPSRK